MQFVKNDELQTIKPNWKGNPFDGTAFQYPKDPFFPKWSTVFKMMTTPNPQRKAKWNDKWRPEVHTDLSYLDSKEDFIVWLGHASFLIQINGVRLLTDPVFYNLALIKRYVSSPIPKDKLTGVDYLLLSHDHRDHADKKSIKEVLRYNQPKKLLTSMRMSSLIESWVGNTTIEEAAWYQVFETVGVKVTYLPARHWCRRGLTDFNHHLWGSFMIEANGKTIYFGADSGYYEHFKEIGELFPNIDVAMIGIGAYKPSFMMQEIHTSPTEAHKIMHDLGAKKLIPMHYGTYDLSNEPISDPYTEVHRIFEEAGEEKRLKAIGVGEAYWL